MENELYDRFDKALEILNLNVYSISKRANGKLKIYDVNLKNDGHKAALRMISISKQIFKVEIIIKMKFFKFYFNRLSREFKRGKIKDKTAYYNLEDLIKSSCLGAGLDREQFDLIYKEYFKI